MRDEWRTTRSRCSFRVSCYVCAVSSATPLGLWAWPFAIEGPGGAGRTRGWPQPGHGIVGTVRGLGRNRARRYRRINNTGSRSYVKRPPCYARRYCHCRWVRSTGGAGKRKERGQDAVGTFYLQRRAPPCNVAILQITFYLPPPLFRLHSTSIPPTFLPFSYPSFSAFSRFYSNRRFEFPSERSPIVFDREMLLGRRTTEREKIVERARLFQVSIHVEEIRGSAFQHCFLGLLLSGKVEADRGKRIHLTKLSINATSRDALGRLAN